ncbi:MAG: glycosyltransferase family protein [Candidatus Binatia bacterium]
MSSILYYITGHGYGHAVRSNQLICSLQRIRPDLTIHVRSTAPDWLFQGGVLQSRQAMDVGILQKDSLQMDLDGTVRACQALLGSVPRLIEQETDFVERHHIRLILGDIPPLCFEIAAQTSIASVAISNFTWSWIYQAYIKTHPAFESIVEQMKAMYRKATLALTLPYAGGMDVFPRQEPLSWVARASPLAKSDARRSFQLPQFATVVLLSFGGLGLDRFPWDKLRNLREFFFVTTGAAKQKIDNMLCLPEAQRNYADLVRASDIVVTKPGYGIVADVLSHQVPVLYTERGDFAEYQYLVQALSECATAEFIPQDRVLCGDLAPYLNRLLDRKPNWPKVPLDGAEVAAAKISELMDL